MLQTEFGHHKTVYARWGGTCSHLGSGHIKQKLTNFFHLGFGYRLHNHINSSHIATVQICYDIMAFLRTLRRPSI